MAESVSISVGERVPPRLRNVLRILRRWPVIPLVILTVLLVTGIFAPLIAPNNPIKTRLIDRNDEPVWYSESTGKYLLGADHLGRDVLSRVIYGSRIVLIVVAVSLTAGALAGTALGLISGHYGGNLDEFIMRMVDVTMSIPYILLALIVVIVFGQGLPVLLAVLAWGTWSHFARLIRGEVLRLKGMDYVALARISGASGYRIMYHHLLPGVINTAIVLATVRVGQLILMEAILSYLGAGVPPPTPAWGSMVSDGRDYLASAWWIAFFPGMAIFLVVMSLNFLGDWMRDRFDPRLRQL